MINRCPKHVCWDITTKCNDTCQFCYRVLDKSDISFEEHMKVLEKLVDSDVKKISFAGGEPLLVDHLGELIFWAKKNGMTTSLITNGILLEDKLPGIMSYLDWITLPLDAGSSEVQANMTRNFQHFDRIQILINYFKGSSIKLKINTVLSETNVKEFYELTSLISHLMPHRWKIFQYFPIRGSALKNESKFSIPNELFYEVVNKAKNNIISKDIYLTVADWKYLNGGYFSISPDGSVRTTINNRDIYIGNLLSQSVNDICSNLSFDCISHWSNRERLPNEFYS